MVARFLSAAGWHVRTELPRTVEEVVAAACSNWFAVAGLTTGSDRHLDTLRETIRRLRDESCNRAIGIMVGGPMFTANPALASAMGADATAPNAPAAVIMAQRLFDLAAPGFTDEAIR